MVHPGDRAHRRWGRRRTPSRLASRGGHCALVPHVSSTARRCSPGHYGFGHWVECFNNRGDGYALPTRCTADGGQEVHGDPGGLAYFPLINRHPATHNHSYYLQVVVNEVSKPVDLTGVPEFLRIAIGPIVDAVFRRESEEYFRGILELARAVAPVLRTLLPGWHE